MNRKIVRALLGLVVFTALSSIMSQAQGLASIVGTVTDPSGAAIASAKIRATQTGTSFSREAATDVDGVGGVNNPAIFCTFGNVGKNSLRLPKTSNWDVQISKYFSISERWKLQLRGEYFNVLNHPNFAPESPSTGTVNSTDQISAFDKINGNSSFGTFRAGQAADPRHRAADGENHFLGSDVRFCRGVNFDPLS